MITARSSSVLARFVPQGRRLFFLVVASLPSAFLEASELVVVDVELDMVVAVLGVVLDVALLELCASFGLDVELSEDGTDGFRLADTHLGQPCDGGLRFCWRVLLSSSSELDASQSSQTMIGSSEE